MNDSNANAPAPNRFMPFLLLLFLGSGCAALIYEIVWLQLLQLVIGLTAVSLGVLLGVFMGGMCLGSLLLPRFISPRHHPLKVYALLELGIGVLGILVLYVTQIVSEAYTGHSGSGYLNIAVRGLVAAACLLPPTLLMGATLPAISRWVETTPQGVSWLGFFYGGNIVGAVFGSLLAGFYLLPKFDMKTATFVAAAVNGLVALVGFALAAMTEHTPQAEKTVSTLVKRSPGAKAIYVAIAMSGLCALGAEVVWTRLMGLMLGATVYTFSIILAIFLVGLGIGSSAGSFVARVSRRPGVGLGICQLLLAGATAWAATMISRSIPNWPVDPSLSGSPWYLFQLDMAICAWTILPAAVLWGASFPLALAAVAAPGQDPGRLVGGVYAANTVGAIFGAIGFSLLVVPMMGGTLLGQRLLIILSAVSALIALVPQFFCKSEATGETPLKGGAAAFGGGAVACGMVAAIWLAVDVVPMPWGIAAYGRYTATYRDRLKPGIVAEKDVPMSGPASDIYCTYMGEGLNGTVAVTYRSDGVRSFHSAGKVQASSDPQDMRLQRLLGHISALAFDKPKSVLVVACGAGVTAGSFVLHPSVTSIVICDIEPLVPGHVAPLFEKENYNVVHDPRVRIVKDDGRHFIRTTKEKFDIISSDPIDPWVKGCAALNTQEYYEMCKAHLNPGGVMSLWMALYENNDDSVKSLISTFYKVFPDGIFWSNDMNGEGYDAVLFGQTGPTKINLDEWQARLDSPGYERVKKSLEEVGFHSTEEMLATYAGSARNMAPWMEGAQINTDKNLRLQYLAGMSHNLQTGTPILNNITRHYRFPDEIFSGSSEKVAALKEKLKIRER